MQTNERFKIMGAVFLILIKDNQVLLQRRYNTGYSDGLYALPSGHIEAGEFGKEALIREIQEEIGIEINEKDLNFVHLLHFRKDKDYMFLFFTCEKWQGEPKILEPEKSDALDWFPLDKLPENIIDYIPIVLKDYRNGVYYSEQGLNS
jgi:8-oxo-dGTP diphosphatase